MQNYAAMSRALDEMEPFWAKPVSSFAEYDSSACCSGCHKSVTFLKRRNRGKIFCESRLEGTHVVKRGEMIEVDKARASDSPKNIVNYLGGYHRCYLGDAPCLEFVSDNLCSMLGYKKAELSDLIGGVYTALMHPDDTSIFDEFASRLAHEEDCESVVYRLIKKDGSVIRVVDTMASIMGNDGCMRGYSVVCEIPDEKQAPKSFSSSEKMAVIKISGADTEIEQTCGATKELFGIKGDARGLHFLDFVSMADRDKIRVAIARAYANEYSGMESCTIVSADGQGFKCDLWVELIRSRGGVAHSTFCVKAEVDLDYQRENREKVMSFGKLLFSSFSEDVFEVDRIENSVKYICHSDRGAINALLNVRMNADDFLEWFLERVSSGDRKAVKDFCVQSKSMDFDWDQDGLGPMKIEFEMTKECHFGHSVALVMVPVSQAKYFLCFNSDFTSLGSGFCSTAVADRKNITVRLFGSFSLTVDGEAIHIKSEKGRELLALLIEKRGAYLTTREAITSLWECEPDETTRARYRKIASRLMGELRAHGIEYVIENDRGARRIIPEFIDCDYYDYRDGLKNPTGDFLPEYSWAEYVRID